MTDHTPAEQVARALTGFVARLARNIAVALNEEPSLQISLRQLRILERLAERPHRTSELASQSMVSQPTATAAIAPLEARGIVRRRPDPEDGRATLIELTHDGYALLAESTTRIHNRIMSIIGDVTEEDAAAAVRIERLLIEGMDRARARRSAAGTASGRPATAAPAKDEYPDRRSRAKVDRG